ncbi:MAG: TetR/AcrR family transcriptional regulator [Acidobacteria bacterium]|nr:MAG: TetR/AcrR family transcriptional regulator [Acidobacteriota bacterium]
MAGSTSARLAGGRTRLSRESILDRYIELADRSGGTEVSLRALGESMGVDPTAVYRHFRSKDELLTAVTDRLLAGVVDAFEPTGDWRLDLRALALLTRGVYLSHPRLARLLAHSPSSHPSNASLIEACLAALRSAGLGDADAAAAVELMENYVAGVSSLNAEMGDAEDGAWRRELAALPPVRYPHVTAVADRLYRGDDRNFEFGLDLILDGLEARAGLISSLPARGP